MARVVFFRIKFQNSERLLVVFDVTRLVKKSFFERLLLRAGQPAIPLGWVGAKLALDGVHTLFIVAKL